MVAGSSSATAVPEVALAEQLGRAAMAHTDEWIAQLGAMVERAQSLDEIAEGLMRLYPRIGTADLAEVIGQALAVAQLTGRAEIADGLG